MMVVMVIMMRVVLSIVMRSTPFFRTMEYQEVHTETIKCRDKHPGQHGKIGKATAGDVGCVHCFYDAVFRIETGKKRRTN